MKKISSFVQNKNIIWTYFKINKKLIIFFLILWTMIVAGPFFITTIGLGGTVISNYSPETSEKGVGSSTTRAGGGISVTLIYQILFNIVGIMFYGLIAIIFINKVIIKEVSTTQISLWLTQPISRTQLIMSKLSFILLLITLMYIPAFAILISFSAQAFDAKELFENALYMGIQYYIYIIMITMLIFTFSLLIIENGTLFTVLSSLLLVYLALMAILGLLIFEMQLQILKKFDYIPRYFGPQLFLTNLLETNWDAERVEYILKKEVWTKPGGSEVVYKESLFINPIKKENYFRLISLDLSMVAIVASMIWYSNVIFKDKSFNI